MGKKTNDINSGRKQMTSRILKDIKRKNMLHMIVDDKLDTKEGENGIYELNAKSGYADQVRHVNSENDKYLEKLEYMN